MKARLWCISSTWLIWATVIGAIFAVGTARGAVTIGDWQPLFKGVDHSVGQRTPGGNDIYLQVANVLRVDLTDPDIRFMHTRPATNHAHNVRETLSSTPSTFLRETRVQVAINANFYDRTFPGDIDSLGVPVALTGLAITEGFVVSEQKASETDVSASVLITTNNQVFIVHTNIPPTNTAGIYTAVTGSYPLVKNGVSVADNSRSPIDELAPRTLLGASQDGRYLYMITVDGRQTGWSDGAYDEDSADWCLQYGLYNAVNLDGGGSTTMVMADCLGEPVRMNRSSYVVARGRERYIGSQFGVYAKPFPGLIQDVQVRQNRGRATLSWQTASNATSFLDYGSTTNYDVTVPVSAVPVAAHQFVFTNQAPGAIVYFRIRAQTDATEASTASCFIVSNLPPTELFGFDQRWRYETNVLNGQPWMAADYNDAGWLGEGPGLLYFDLSAPGDTQTAPKGTELPPMIRDIGSRGRVATTFYFRTRFDLTNTVRPISLLFSNYIDDGAVFYLNGREIQRVRMPAAPTPPLWSTLANGSNPSSGCGGDAIVACPTVFSISGDALTNLVQGLNVLAAEVHNLTIGSPDVVFGTHLFGAFPLPALDPPTLQISTEAGQLRLEWAAESFVIQETAELLDSGTLWLDMSGGARTSPVLLPLRTGVRYFRLREP